MVTDPISQLVNKLKVANIAGKENISISYSKMKEAILEALQREGFVKGVTKKGKKVNKSIEADLVYVDDQPKINDVQLISKQSRRVYYGAKEVHRVQNGFGALIMTTPKGVMSDKEARKANVGGEALFKIW